MASRILPLQLLQRQTLRQQARTVVETVAETVVLAVTETATVVHAETTRSNFIENCYISAGFLSETGIFYWTSEIK